MSATALFSVYPVLGDNRLDGRNIYFLPSLNKFTRDCPDVPHAAFAVLGGMINGLIRMSSHLQGISFMSSLTSRLTACLLKKALVLTGPVLIFGGRYRTVVVVLGGSYLANFSFSSLFSRLSHLFSFSNSSAFFSDCIAKALCSLAFSSNCSTFLRSSSLCFLNLRNVLYLCSSSNTRF